MKEVFKLSFIGTDTTKANLSIPFPDSKKTALEIAEAMDGIINSNILVGKYGFLVSKYSAQYIQTNITEYAMQ
jgi:hypothetical protein